VGYDSGRPKQRRKADYVTGPDALEAVWSECGNLGDDAEPTALDAEDRELFERIRVTYGIPVQIPPSSPQHPEQPRLLGGSPLRLGRGRAYRPELVLAVTHRDDPYEAAVGRVECGGVDRRARLVAGGEECG